MPRNLLSEEPADERPVVTTKFPETRSRLPWQSLLHDIDAKLQELRAVLEGVVAAVLPFLQHPAAADNDSCWTCDDPATPSPVRVIIQPGE